MKKRILSVILISVIAVSLIIALYKIHDKLYYLPNVFLRLVPPHALETTSAAITLPSNNWQIAGETKHNVYLSNQTYCNYLIKINLTNLDSQHIVILDSTLEKMQFKRPYTLIDSPYYCIVDGQKPAIIKGNLKDNKVISVSKDSVYFDIAVPMDLGSWCIRYLQPGSGFCLGKKVSDSLIQKPALLEKQVDGIFCKDGEFNYDALSGKLVYVYYYRNQFIVADSNLNLLYRGRTIDTISIAKIKVNKPDKTGKQTLSTTPPNVNKQSCVYNNRLFIHSPALARNEDKEVLKKASAIDVYDLNNGKYLFSFYISDDRDGKLKQFRVLDCTIVVLYEKHVQLFRLDIKYLNF